MASLVATAPGRGPYRLAVLLLWGLAAIGTAVSRSLFWDGASFLVNLLDLGRFHGLFSKSMDHT